MDQKILDYIVKQPDGMTTFGFIVGFSGKSSRTISKHLSVLVSESNNVITWCRPKAGFKGFIKLSDTAKLKRKYGYLIIDYTNVKGICKGEKNAKITVDKKKRRKAILFLLMSLSIGSKHYEIPSKAEPGDFVIKNSKGKHQTVRIKSENGFSTNDLQIKDFQPMTIQDYIPNDKSMSQEIQKVLDQLQVNEDVPIYNFSTQKDEIRIDIKHRPLKMLLLWCTQIILLILRIMTDYWYLLSKQPKTDEYEWFCFLVGEERAISFFQRIEANRLLRRTIKDLYIEVKLSGLVKKDIDNILRQTPYQSLFSKSEIKYKIFQSSTSMFLINHFLTKIKEDIRIQQILAEKKYEFFTDELKKIISPTFLKSYKMKIYQDLSQCLSPHN